MNPYFSASTLAVMAHASESAMTDSAVIYRVIDPPTDDGMGGEVQAEPVVVYDGIPVRTRPLRGNADEVVINDALQSDALEVLVTQMSVILTTTDVVFLKGLYYEVKGIIPVPTAAFERHYLVQSDATQA